jgi:DNA-directed RNA polymerase II subunit RPB3
MGLPEVGIEPISNYETKISLKEIDVSIVNSLRRVMINEIPTMAIDLIFVEINSSLMHDEFLAHRIGLVPLFSEQAEEFRYTRECECEKFCSQCSVAFSLDVISEEKNNSVFSTDLVFLNPTENSFTKPIIPVHDSSLPNVSNSDPILLAKLNQGQRIKLIGIAKKGIGMEHAKWSPVSIIRIKKQPVFSLDIHQINFLLPTTKTKKEIASMFPHIFKYDDSNTNLVYHGMYENGRSSFSFFLLKKFIAFLIKKKINPKHILENIDPTKTNFEMYIESTGVIKPEIIFKKAIDILKKKLNTIGIHLEKLNSTQLPTKKNFVKTKVNFE